MNRNDMYEGRSHGVSFAIPFGGFRDKIIPVGTKSLVWG
jgi:hypothetical protein